MSNLFCDRSDCDGKLTIKVIQPEDLLLYDLDELKEDELIWVCDNVERQHFNGPYHCQHGALEMRRVNSERSSNYGKMYYTCKQRCQC